MVDDNFFLYKIYALFHDPPHKMTVMLNRQGHDFFRDKFLRIYKDIEKYCNRMEINAHEAEAQILLYYLVFLKFDDQRLYDICKIYSNNRPKVHSIIRSADVYASEFNRWVINYLYITKQSHKIVYYYNFHNIFDPEKFKEINYDIDEDTLLQFVEKFHDIINKIDFNNSTIKDLYFLIYTIYEPLWIYYNLPVEVEDSRAPYFTIFDHLYASASMVNWVYFNKSEKTQNLESTGFYVVIDIPGVQEIINAARKASDYWAGSWTVSMLVWLTVWQLIKEYGPDVLLAPTARFNPLYYAMVMNYLQNSGVINESTRKEIDEILNSVLGELSGIHDYKEFLREPIIPATASLILPKEKGSCEIKIENKIMEYYRNAYNCIIKEIPSGNIESELCREFTQAFGIEILNSGKKEEPFIRALVQEAEKYANNLLIRPAIYIIDIDEVKDEIEKDVNEKSIDKFLNCAYKHRSQSSNDYVKNMFLSQMLFHYISTKLYRIKIKEKYKQNVLPKPEWFSNFKPNFNYTNGGRNWEYCTVCGNEPAIFNFNKEIGKGDYYKKDTEEKLIELVKTNLSTDNEGLDRLKVWFKPGEKLGPICIIKRGLYYSLHYAGLKVFMSTDDIAYSYYKEVINPQVRDAEDCKKFEEFLNSEETNVYATFGDPTTARRIINKCSLLPDKSLSFLSKEYGVNNVTKNFVNAIKGYRDSYAIIKADADDMTELARAEIKAERYKGIAKEIVNNNTKGSKRKSDKCAKKLVEDSYEFAHKLAEAINNGYILMSPTYRVALSTAMMLTILRDIKTVEVENHGQIIYAGGDDVVALVSVDRLIDTLVGLEKNFIGEDGFFKVRNWYIPALSPKGRSFSVRISNIADFMTNEIHKATELLNKVKNVTWYARDKNDEIKKFSVIFSSSRSNYESILPMYSLDSLLLLKKMWLLNISGILSSSVFEDYENSFKELINHANRQQNLIGVSKSLVNYVLLRNNGGELIADFNNLLDKGRQVSVLKESSTEVDELFKAFRIMRGVL